MEIKKPKNFKDILSLQKHLDDNIHSIRPRTFDDIKMSLIAECVEFNEETIFSHKTWKTKPYSKDKELEELTDIYFFFADILRFIHYVYTDKLAIAMDELIAITYQYNYTTDNILNSYWEKWQKNMKRIGNEWN